MRKYFKYVTSSSFRQNFKDTNRLYFSMSLIHSEGSIAIDPRVITSELAKELLK